MNTLRSHRTARALLALLFFTALAAAASAVFIAWPLPAGMLDRREVVSVRFTDRTGRTLRELRSREDGRSVPLPGLEPPPQVRAAFLAAEDHRFFQHAGVDLQAVGRALAQNLKSGRIVSGASTITQQLARRLEPHDRTLPGKLFEALQALRLTVHLSRDRILLEYLNRVPLGNSTFGVEAASELYFGRPAAHLSLGQAALLAGMARSPARNDPYRHIDHALARMKQVLALMQRNGYITADECRVASSAPLDLTPPEQVFEAPHLVAHLAGALSSLGLDNAVRLETTLDPSLQADIEAAIREEIEGLADKRVGQGAVIVLDNASGEVLAYAGSANFLDDETGGQIDGVRSLRQPGSALKPFAYGLALASGYTPARVLSDVETHLATPSGDYVPRNYDRRVHGPVRLRAALANSYNVPAVRLADELGPERILQTMRAAGFQSLTEDAAHYGVGIVLGNGDVSLREAARAFRGLAMGGMVGPLTEIRHAWDAEGRQMKVPRELEPRRFLPENAVALLTDILSDEQARAPAFGLDNALRLPFPVAVKTGTSRAYVDNWTLGYTRERTVGVWVGNFDGTPMKGVSGITGAGPLFKRAMTRAMRDLAPAPLVDRSRFQRADICALSGQLAGPACPGLLHEVFLPGTVPAQHCAMHRLEPVDARTGLPARCGDPRARMRTVTDVGPGYYAWARGEGLNAGPSVDRGCLEPGPEPVREPGIGPVREPGIGPGREPGIGPVRDSSAASGATSRGLPGAIAAPRLLAPGDGDEYLIDPGIPARDQTIPVHALAPAGTSRLELRTDDGRIVPLAPPFSTRIPATPGQHRLELWAPGSLRPVGVASYRVR